MANIGVVLEPDQLVLTRGRDFTWSFTNLDEQGNPLAFPAGDLFFEIATRGEHNASGHIDITGANGGTYVLHQDGNDSTSLPFDASENVVRQAIAGIAECDLEDVNVTGTYTPQWIFTVNWNSAIGLSAGTVELFNSTVHAAFEALDFMTGGLGVSLDGYYETTSYTFTLTYKGSLLEEELINFTVGVIADIIAAINSALTAVEHFTGEIADISAIYAPKRHFDYEFVNGKALTPVSAITATSSLSGHEPAINVVQDAKGRAEFTIWNFVLSGADASIKVESEDADAVPARTLWQLVFLPSGEPKGGSAIARGFIREQQ